MNRRPTPGAGDDGPPPAHRGWLSHNAALLAAPMPFVMLAAAAANSTTGIAALAAATFATLVLTLMAFSHRYAACDYCLTRAPRSPTSSVRRNRLLLPLYHGVRLAFMGLVALSLKYKALFYVGIFSVAFAVSAGLLPNMLHTVTTTIVLIGATLASLALLALDRHIRLAPWCPHCIKPRHGNPTTH